MNVIANLTFDKIIKKYDLKGQIKTVSNIVCEYMITSDSDFFKRIGEEETKRYFETAYKFVSEYKNLGEKYIISAKVHYDEKSPHMHLIFLPAVPDITDIHMNRLSKKRDEVILEEIIKPKDQLINELYHDNFLMQQALLRNTKLIEKAEKYQKERTEIMSDNGDLHNEVEIIKKEYEKKEFDLEWNYKNKINHLEKENNRLNKIIDKFYKTIDKFIEWICDKFNFGNSKELVKKFEDDTHTFIDPVKQMKKEKREKDIDFDR